MVINYRSHFNLTEQTIRSRSSMTVRWIETWIFNSSCSLEVIDNRGNRAIKSLNANWRRLMAFQVRRSQKMLHAGAQLGKILPGRIGLEIRLTILGGDAILEKLKLQPDVFRHRPILTWQDWPRLLWRAIRAK